MGPPSQAGAVQLLQGRDGPLRSCAATAAACDTFVPHPATRGPQIVAFALKSVILYSAWMGEISLAVLGTKSSVTSRIDGARPLMRRADRERPQLALNRTVEGH
jgi:hypothetical protein